MHNQLISLNSLKPHRFAVSNQYQAVIPFHR